MRIRWLLSLAITSLLLASALAFPGPVGAAAPTFTLTTIDDSGVDPIGTAQCGFTVLFHTVGTIKRSTQTLANGQQVEIARYRLKTTFTNPATGTTITIVSAGIDRLVTKDGRSLLAVLGTGAILDAAGNPIRFSGRRVLDVTTGETLLSESGLSQSGCALLQ